MAALETDIQYIKGVGEQRAKTMAKLGIATLGDLVCFFPRAYEDRTRIKPISLLVPGETVCVRAMAAAAPRLSHIRKGLDPSRSASSTRAVHSNSRFSTRASSATRSCRARAISFTGRSAGRAVGWRCSVPSLKRKPRAF
jgi:RecG-like helicase